MATDTSLRTAPPFATVPAPLPEVKKGACFVFFAFELGHSINLDSAALKIRDLAERAKFQRNRKAPKYFDYDPPPLRITTHGPQINLGKFFTKPQADITVFDFGACSVCYEVEITGPVGNLIELSNVLYDNSFLLADARDRVTQLVAEIGSAIQRPEILESVEDFTIFQIEEMTEDVNFADFLKDGARDLSQVLRAESESLSNEEIKDALATRISYSSDDLTIVDWNACLFFGSKVEDVIAVLEFCNVELLEMRTLDEQLDDHLEEAYQTLLTGKKNKSDLWKIAQLQVDSAVLYEAVENALKLLGDQYLARVYSSASSKFHLPEWNSSILRKLDTLDSIYQKLTDRAHQKRSDMHEWIIILLILIEIIMGLWERM